MPSNETFDVRGPAGRLEAILMHPEAPRVAARDPRVRAVFALGYPLRMADHLSGTSPLGMAVADWAEARPWQLAASGAGFTPAERAGGLGGATQHPPEESQSRRPRVEDGFSSGSSSAAGPEPPPRGR